jgi:hypothetical protein
MNGGSGKAVKVKPTPTAQTEYTFMLPLEPLKTRLIVTLSIYTVLAEKNLFNPIKPALPMPIPDY